MLPDVAVGPPTVVETLWQALARGSGVCPLPPHGRRCRRAPEGGNGHVGPTQRESWGGLCRDCVGGVAMAGL